MNRGSIAQMGKTLHQFETCLGLQNTPVVLVTKPDFFKNFGHRFSYASENFVVRATDVKHSSQPGRLVIWCEKAVSPCFHQRPTGTTSNYAAPESCENLLHGMFPPLFFGALTYHNIVAAQQHPSGIQYSKEVFFRPRKRTVQFQDPCGKNVSLWITVFHRSRDKKGQKLKPGLK